METKKFILFYMVDNFKYLMICEKEILWLVDIGNRYIVKETKWKLKKKNNIFNFEDTNSILALEFWKE